MNKMRFFLYYGEKVFTDAVQKITSTHSNSYVNFIIKCW